LIFSVCLLGAGFAAQWASAGVNVNVNLGVPLAPVVVAAPPALVLIPGTPVYFAPEVDVDIFFTDGYWWTSREGHWCRARGYEGPWVAVGPKHVPRSVILVPRNYRTAYGRERRIPYGQWKKQKHWREEEDRGDGDRGHWKEGRRGHGGRGHRDD
jgi:hypothetical protein